MVNRLNNSLNKLTVNNLKLIVDKPLEKVILIMVMDGGSVFCKKMQSLIKLYNMNFLWEFQVINPVDLTKQLFSILSAKNQACLSIIDWDFYQEKNEAIETIVRLNEVFKNSNNGGKILVISSQGEETSIFLTMQAGASGYILKENLSIQMHLAIAAMFNGQVYLCPEIAARFFRIFHLCQGRNAQTDSGQLPQELTESSNYNPYKLTNREREVLRLLVEGYRNEEIASCLYITIATVKAHLTTIFKKLGVKNRNRAIVRSLHLGLL